VSIGDGGPRIPSPNLSDAGKGRFSRSRRTAVVQRFTGTQWVQVGRYGSLHDADEALDLAIAAGADAGSLRVVEAGGERRRSRSSWWRRSCCRPWRP
jgi:hypothetical protein